jgi:hypothetical protein
MFVLLTASDCENVENNNIEIPSVEQIKSDLLNKKIGTWTFAGMEEFKNVTVIKDSLINDNELVLNVQLKLIDKDNFSPYDGDVQIHYIASEDGVSWEFESIYGKITENTNGLIIGNNNLNETQDIVEKDNLNNSEDVNSNKKSESEIIYKDCEWCGNEFKYEKKYDSRIGYYYEGGYAYCKKNDTYSSARGAKQLLLGAPIPKFCSTKCACEAEN